MGIVINRKMKYLTLVIFSSLFFSCKQDSKINLPELKEGYYEFEILEKYLFLPDTTWKQEYQLSFSQISSKPGFLIQKSNIANRFQACVTYRGLIKPGCSTVNFPLNLVYINNDSLYLQNPWFYIDGNFNGYVPKNGSGVPNQFDSNTLKYQVRFSGLKLNNNSEIEGFWNELYKCFYTNFDVNPPHTDSIVEVPLFVKFKLKYVKGI